MSTDYLDYLEAQNFPEDFSEPQSKWDNFNEVTEIVSEPVAHPTYLWLTQSVQDAKLVHKNKYCPGCEKLLKRDSFHADWRRHDGLKSLCIICRKARRKRYAD